MSEDYVPPARDVKRTIHIEIAGLKEAQALAIEDMLATWMQLGGLGSSRWTAFFADGDGDFHPKVTVDGRKPELTPYLTKEQRWRKREPETMYWMDYDGIAWALRKRDGEK